MARAIAVLGGAPQLRHAASMAGISEDRARELCDGLRGAEILAPGHPIDFVHPLVRTAVYGELSEEGRSDAHRRAAELISSTGGDAREVAPHLMACAPNGDQWVAEQLRDAAREAMAAGAPEAARRYLERALEEPALEEVELTYELGRALWQGSVIDAPELLVVRRRAFDRPRAPPAGTRGRRLDLLRLWKPRAGRPLPGSRGDIGARRRRRRTAAGRGLRCFA